MPTRSAHRDHAAAEGWLSAGLAGLRLESDVECEATSLTNALQMQAETQQGPWPPILHGA